MLEPAPTVRGDGPCPVHVAIIMDGNGRWARSRSLPRIAGHQKGAEAVRALVRNCRELGIRFVTIYAFSSENWKRSPAEVDDLMGLLRHYLRREIAELQQENVRIRFIGDRSRFSQDIIGLITSAESSTRDNEALTLTIALNYGSRSEIATAARHLAEAVKAGRVAPDEITEDTFSRFLESAEIPDPDLLIRTSGEQRLSNFLLWQSAYTELVFIPTLWPDFDKAQLLQAIDEFRRRERRYGGTGG